jgi:hypothetical protein
VYILRLFLAYSNAVSKLTGLDSLFSVAITCFLLSFAWLLSHDIASNITEMRNARQQNPSRPKKKKILNEKNETTTKPKAK